jgi:hypothetical protein
MQAFPHGRRQAVLLALIQLCLAPGMLFVALEQIGLCQMGGANQAAISRSA